MPPHMPIQFLRKLANGVMQLAGNRVQLEDDTGAVINAANPIPVNIAPGGIATDVNVLNSSGAGAVIGATNGAAVITDADGTLQQYLRGLIKLIISGLSVKGTGFSIPVALTVTNGVYTIGDVVGGLITFANAASAAGKRSVIHTITLAGVAALDYELWFFPADIATPALDNAAFTLVAADVAACKGVIPIAASDYKAPQSAFNVATLRSVGFEFTCVATTLYAYLKAVAVTSPGTTTLTLTIKGEFID